MPLKKKLTIPTDQNEIIENIAKNNEVTINYNGRVKIY